MVPAAGGSIASAPASFLSPRGPPYGLCRRRRRIVGSSFPGRWIGNAPLDSHLAGCSHTLPISSVLDPQGADEVAIEHRQCSEIPVILPGAWAHIGTSKQMVEMASCWASGRAGCVPRDMGTYRNSRVEM